ncbi:MAG TPA: chemotaxis protein CheW [Anaeromyxobacteraceae bacterium]|nr:chemotaxis protein CheW [Anaeromyxobacteraceae bacterium]
MDFLEIRRKAKERAEARGRGAAPSPMPAISTRVPMESPAFAPSPERVAVERPTAAASPDAAIRSSDFPVPDLARLEPLDAVVDAIPVPGGALTPMPDLPPWSEALGDIPEAPADLADAARSLADAQEMSSVLAPTLGPATLGATTLVATPLVAPPVVAPPAPGPAANDPLDEFFYREDETAPGVTDLDFSAPPAPVEVEVADPRREFLTFFLGLEEYAVEIERVREVLKAPAVTDVPRAPRHVLGVIMIRGDVIAVFDPRRRLGLPEVDRPGSPRVLVCDDGLGPIGLMVDAVSQVVRLRRSEIEPRPQGIGNVSADYISGIGRQAGRMFIVLDLPVVLRGKAPKAEEEARP